MARRTRKVASTVKMDHKDSPNNQRRRPQEGRRSAIDTQDKPTSSELARTLQQQDSNQQVPLEDSTLVRVPQRQQAMDTQASNSSHHMACHSSLNTAIQAHRLRVPSQAMASLSMVRRRLDTSRLSLPTPRKVRRVCYSKVCKVLHSSSRRWVWAVAHLNLSRHSSSHLPRKCA